MEGCNQFAFGSADQRLPPNAGFRCDYVKRRTQNTHGLSVTESGAGCDGDPAGDLFGVIDSPKLPACYVAKVDNTCMQMPGARLYCKGRIRQFLVNVSIRCGTPRTVLLPNMLVRSPRNESDMYTAINPR